MRIRISLSIPGQIFPFAIYPEPFHSLKSRETVEELILYITGREEGEEGERNGCPGGRARAHLSEVNAHARREHYFVRPHTCVVRFPPRRGVEIKNCRAIFFKSFRASLACLDRADTSGSTTGGAVGQSYMSLFSPPPTPAVCFRARILSQRSNSDVSNGHISIYALLQLYEKEAARAFCQTTQGSTEYLE